MELTWRWDTADSEIEVPSGKNPELSKFLASLEKGRPSIALHASTVGQFAECQSAAASLKTFSLYQFADFESLVRTSLPTLKVWCVPVCRL